MGRRTAPESPSPGRLRRACVGRRPAAPPSLRDARALPDRAAHRPRRTSGRRRTRSRAGQPPGHRGSGRRGDQGCCAPNRARHSPTDELPRRPPQDHGRRCQRRRSHRRRRLLPGQDRTDGRPREPVDSGNGRAPSWGLPRRARQARCGGRRTRPVRRCPLRHRLRRRRHDPADRRPAGGPDDRPDPHGLLPHPHGVPRFGGALPRPRRRGEPGLLRLVEPVEPVHVPTGLPAAPRLPARARAAA